MDSIPYLRFIGLAALLVLAAGPAPALCDLQFQQFFPGWSKLLSGILQNNCSRELVVYNKAGSRGGAKWPVIDCILGNFSESRKAEAATAALTLGLAPTILQNIGASTAETSILFLRRPFLTILLAAASPSPRNMDGPYADPLTALRQPADLGSLPAFLLRPTALIKIVVSLVEYVLAVLAAVNVAVLSYQLGVWSFFAAANNPYDIALWAYTNILIHLCGILGLWLLVRVAPTDDGPPGHVGVATVWNWLSRGIHRELVPTAYGEPLRLVPRYSRPSLLSLLVLWVLSIAPTLQVIYGTISLSGSLLTSQWDARICLFRYLLSAIVARGILSYELAGIRSASAASCELEAQEGDKTHRLMESKGNTSEEAYELPPRALNEDEVR